MFFVGFYATELTNIIAEALNVEKLDRLVPVVVVGFVFTAVAFFALLWPPKHAKSKKLVGILVLLALVWAFALIRWYQLTHAHPL